MPHPEVTNKTPFVFEPLFTSDENGRPLLVAIVKATFDIRDGVIPEISDQQDPVYFSGVFWGNAEQSSYRFEPEAAFTKLATDVVLVGSAHAAHAGDTHVDVKFQLGSVGKMLRVFGDRYWVRSLGQVIMTRAEPFESIPLTYEHAFGGWDRSHADPERHDFERRNPVGRGFRSKVGSRADLTPLPNIEDPHRLMCDWADRPMPAGVGFTSANWQPRAALGGTYGEAWMRTRMPLLPADFDQRFFSAGSEGLIYPEFVRGDEPVLVENGRRLCFDLPGLPPPSCLVSTRQKKSVKLPTNLDTVVVDCDENKFNLIWRGYTVLRTGVSDVEAIHISQAAAG